MEDQLFEQVWAWKDSDQKLHNIISIIFTSNVRFLNIFGGSSRVCGAVRRLLLPLLRHQASTAAAAAAPRTARRRPQHRGRRRRRWQPQRRGQRRGGLNLSLGWHSKYCQARRFFFTAFGAPSSLQFQALNIPQWTSLQCLVSSIYNYLYISSFLFGLCFYLGPFGMAFLIVLLSKTSQEWLTASNVG